MYSTDNYTPDRLFGGSQDVTSDTAILVSGQSILRGSALGKIAASGKLTKCVSTAVDGSQFAMAILAADTDSTAGDKTCPLYLAGEFNDAAVTWGGADTSATSPFTVGAVNWAATTAKIANALVFPTVANGFVYTCTTAGTTAGTQPTWPLIDGNVVVDGTVVWTAKRILTHKDWLRNMWGIYLKTTTPH
jgi:hypothetical protein